MIILVAVSNSYDRNLLNSVTVISSASTCIQFLLHIYIMMYILSVCKEKNSLIWNPKINLHVHNIHHILFS
jgi:hypothetical protein